MPAHILPVNGHAAANHELPRWPFLELTEVYTFALYGVAQNAKTFMQEINAEPSRNLSTWGHWKGPEWLVPHFRLMMDMRTWSPKRRKEWVSAINAYRAISGNVESKLDPRIHPFQERDPFDSKEDGVIRRAGEAFGLAPDLSTKAVVEHLMQFKNADAWLTNERMSADTAFDRVQREVGKLKQEIELSDTFQWLLCFMAGERDITLFDGERQPVPSTFFAGQVGFAAGENMLWSPGHGHYPGLRMGRRDAQELLERLRAERTRAIKPVRQTAKAQNDCCKWLKGLMAGSPDRRPKPRRDLFKEACVMFPGLGNPDGIKPSRLFERAWKSAMRETRAHWSAPGRTSKSPR